MRVALATLLVLILTALPVASLRGPAAAQDQPANPKLARLEVDIWPEFDQPAALVIVHAEIAPDVSLPASASFRIPTTSGGPAAVATTVSDNSPLLDLPYDVRDTQPDFITLEIDVPNRFFQIEFYDELKPGTGGSNYTYLWPGDYAVGQLIMQVQQPAGATSLTVDPDLGDPTTAPDGLLYREANLGAFEAGKTLTVDVQYQKTDPRTTAEILGLDQPQPDTGGGSSTRETVGIVLAIAAGVAAVALAIFGGIMLWRRLRPSPDGTLSRRAERRRAAAERGPECKRCHEPLRPSDRFCPVCGRTVHVKRE